jgi:hypothetical protein
MSPRATLINGCSGSPEVGLLTMLDRRPQHCRTRPNQSIIAGSADFPSRFSHLRGWTLAGTTPQPLSRVREGHRPPSRPTQQAPASAGMIPAGCPPRRIGAHRSSSLVRTLLLLRPPPVCQQCSHAYCRLLARCGPGVNHRSSWSTPALTPSQPLRGQVTLRAAPTRAVWRLARPRLRYLGRTARPSVRR